MICPEVKRLENEEHFNAAPGAWLENIMKDGLNFMIAYTDDALLWGRWENSELILSSTLSMDFVKLTELKDYSIQEIHVFGETGELRLWRENNHFTQCAIMDGSLSSQPPPEIFEENYLLWGECENTKNGFSWMREGQQDLLHILPIEVSNGAKAVIRVRHYVEYDGEGQARIAFSRLVNLKAA
jgi:CRISPR-associated protein (TIGR03984 family)